MIKKHCIKQFLISVGMLFLLGGGCVENPPAIEPPAPKPEPKRIEKPLSNKQEPKSEIQKPTSELPDVVPKIQETKCSAHLSHPNPLITRAYQESFTMFGAYLLKYQEILKNQKDVTEEFNKIDTLKILSDGKYFDTKINHQGIGDLDEIDKNIDLSQPREIWQKWCAHPDNFLSWLLHPIMWIETNNIEELATKTKEFGYSSKDTMIHWFDDGFWILSKIMGIKIKGGAQETSTWQADPEKWLIKLEGDKAITK